MTYRVLHARRCKDGSLVHHVTFKGGDIGRADWIDDGLGWSAFAVRVTESGFRHEHLLGNFSTGEQVTAAVCQDHEAGLCVAPTRRFHSPADYGSAFLSCRDSAVEPGVPKGRHRARQAPSGPHEQNIPGTGSTRAAFHSPNL